MVAAGEKPLEEKLLDWLKSEGYSLQMRTAQVFKEAGFDVSQSQCYLDPESDDLREIDVVASINRHWYVSTTLRQLRLEFRVQDAHLAGLDEQLLRCSQVRVCVRDGERKAA